MIVITGGAGFIGSNLAAGLEAHGQGAYVICDRFGTDDKWQNLTKRRLTDIVPPERIPAFLDANADKITAIVHLGAISTTTEADVDLILENNYRFSVMLYEWCTAQRKPLIYASSAATYGNGSAGFEDGYDLATLARYQPLNAYGWSKHLFDVWCARKLAAEAPQPPQLAGIKFFNVYGPNEYHKGPQRSVAHQIYPVARDGDRFQLFRSENIDYPDGGQLRDFIWVGDCVAAILWLLDSPKVSGLFNLGTGKARSFFDLTAAVYRAADRAMMVSYREMPPELQGKYQYFTQAKMERLRAAGYTSSFTSLEEGVRRYVQDYLAATDPYA